VVLGGFGAGLALVHLLDALDDRFRSLDEMQNRLGVAVLSMVQQMKSPDAAGLEAVTMHSDPTSPESEAFRTLRTALDLSHPDARQLGSSSAEPGDGKTTVLANLAVGYAQSDKKTLLIDADLRRPGLTRMMDLRGMHGLSEILRSDGDIAELAAIHIQASGLKGLDILPSGPRPTNPHELLAGARLSQFLAWAAGVYDQILIDSPPALATSDTAIIGRLVDGVILVVQPAKNRRRLVTRVVESLLMLKIPLLGLVINRVGSDQDQGYYNYHSGYGYGYGYSYGYGYGYGSDYGSHDEGEEGGHASDESYPSEDTAPVSLPEESKHSPRTIRRRAA
jgi:capsular exopolysaccharide synthesis family protein